MIDGALHEYKERPGRCSACGNSPVNHFEHYISNTLGVWSAESAYAKKGVFARIVRGVDSMFDQVEQILLKVLGSLPFATYSSDVHAAATYRSQVIWEEAQRREIEMQQMLVFGKATEIYRAHISGRWFYFQSLPIPHERRGKNVAWLDDKYLLKRFFTAHHVPTPRCISVRTLAEAHAAFKSLETIVVVKPRSGSRGRHTTVRVGDILELDQAFRSAKQLCSHVVIEEYLSGPVCRATLVDGKLAGFFMADAPSVIGDGVSSVATLIEKKNAQKEDRVENVVLSDEHKDFLRRQGLNDASVLGYGEIVYLTHRTGRLFGGVTRELVGEEHPKLRATLERAAGEMGVAIVGFDLIIPDPENDPDSQAWGIIEANTLPYIDLHYLPLHGKPSNVAAQVWDLWTDSIHSGAVDGSGARATIQG